MSYNFLDKTGLAYFWQKVKAKIPTKTSQLTNDSGFLTTHQDITGKVDKKGVLNVLRYPATTGYLKFAECDLSYGGYGNKYVVLFVTTEYGTSTKVNNGLIFINIRGNGTNASTVSEFYWLMKNYQSNNDNSALCWAANDHKVEFYRKAYATTEYSQVSFKILHIGDFETASKWNFNLINVPFVAGTPLDTPIGNVTNITDNGYINRANVATKATQDSDGNAINTTYYKASNPNGYTSNTGTVTSVAVKMNNTTKGTVTTSGTIDLGTVITAHQDISGKQDKLTTQTAYTSKGSATKVPQITTNSLGQVTGITEVDIEGGGSSIPKYKIYCEDVQAASQQGYPDLLLIDIDYQVTPEMFDLSTPGLYYCDFEIESSAISDLTSDSCKIQFVQYEWNEQTQQSDMTVLASLYTVMRVDGQNEYIPHDFWEGNRTYHCTIEVAKYARDSWILFTGEEAFVDKEVTQNSTNAVSSGAVYTALQSAGGVDLNTVYPVGSIYMSVNNTNPATLFGIGTWEQLKDRFLLGAGDTYTAGNTGGEANHTLSVEEMPSHTHIQNAHNHTQNAHSHYVERGDSNGTNVWCGIAPNGGYTNKKVNYYSNSVTATNKEATATNQNTGGGQAHNNMPPYLTVYMWKRTA